MENNYYQIIETTEEEKFEIYDKLSKKELIGMLIQANKMLDIKTNPSKYLFAGADRPIKP